MPGVGNVPGAMVNVGNPHFVLFVETEDFSAHGLTWQELGAKISTSPLFPHGTNVEFVRVLSPSEIAFRIYERGCGPTTSSGTGTCASSAAAMALRGVDRELTAVAEGGRNARFGPTATLLCASPGQPRLSALGRFPRCDEFIELDGKAACAASRRDSCDSFAGEYAEGGPGASRRSHICTRLVTRPFWEPTHSIAGHSTMRARWKIVWRICMRHLRIQRSTEYSALAAGGGRRSCFPILMLR